MSDLKTYSKKINPIIARLKSNLIKERIPFFITIYIKNNEEHYRTHFFSSPALDITLSEDRLFFMASLLGSFKVEDTLKEINKKRGQLINYEDIISFEIIPLINELHLLAFSYGFPYFLAIPSKNTENTTSYYYSMLLPEDVPLEIEGKNIFPDLVKVSQGKYTLPQSIHQSIALENELFNSLNEKK